MLHSVNRPSVLPNYLCVSIAQWKSTLKVALDKFLQMKIHLSLQLANTDMHHNKQEALEVRPRHTLSPEEFHSLCSFTKWVGLRNRVQDEIEWITAIIPEKQAPWPWSCVYHLQYKMCLLRREVHKRLAKLNSVILPAALETNSNKT